MELLVARAHAHQANYSATPCPILEHGLDKTVARLVFRRHIPCQEYSGPSRGSERRGFAPYFATQSGFSSCWLGTCCKAARSSQIAVEQSRLVFETHHQFPVCPQDKNRLLSCT